MAKEFRMLEMAAAIWLLAILLLIAIGTVAETLKETASLKRENLYLMAVLKRRDIYATGKMGWSKYEDAPEAVASEAPFVAE